MASNFIELRSKYGDLEIEVSGKLGFVPILAGKVIIVDTCLIFPAVLPKEKRNVQSLQKYSEKLHPLKASSNNNIYIARREMEKLNRRRMQVLEAIEDGKFSRRGLYFGVPSVVSDELFNLTGWASMYRRPEDWASDLMKHSYHIELEVGDFRREYADISGLFRSDGDFSVAMTSYLLGCSLATDDYVDFNAATKEKFKKIYLKRWGLDRPFSSHDSESLLMFLEQL